MFKDRKAEVTPVMIVVLAMVVAVITIAGMYIYFNIEGEDPYWETDTDLGTFQEEILVTYEDGTVDSLKLLGHQYSTLLSTITYDGKEVSNAKYNLYVVATGSGFENWDYKDWTLKVTLIQEVPRIYVIPGEQHEYWITQEMIDCVGSNKADDLFANIDPPDAQVAVFQQDATGNWKSWSNIDPHNSLEVISTVFPIWVSANAGEEPSVITIGDTNEQEIIWSFNYLQTGTYDNTNLPKEFDEQYNLVYVGTNLDVVLGNKPPGQYTLKWEPQGVFEYRGNPDGGWESVPFPAGRQVTVSVQSDSTISIIFSDGFTVV